MTIDQTGTGKARTASPELPNVRGNRMESAIEKIAPAPGRQLEYRDPNEKGLRLRVSYEGSKAWTYRARLRDGTAINLTLDRWPATSWADAREKARAARQVIDKGGDPRPEKGSTPASAPTAPATFGDVRDRFLRQHTHRTVRGIARPIRTSTLEERRRILTGKDFAAWEHRPFTSITKADIKAVRDSVKERGQVMSRLTLAHLKTLFNWALEADLIEVSPAAGVKSPGGAERDRVLTDDEVAILWHAADSVPTYGDLTKLLLLTGQRVGEVKGIRWEEIDLRERVWNLPGERAKNHIPNIVPLANQAIEILTRIGPKDTGLVFASKKGGVIHDEDRAKKTLDKLVAATAGKPANAFATRWTFHDLRRTVRSGMSKLGVRREIAELVLNHRTGAGLTGVAGVYDRYEYLPEKTQAIARWAASLERLVSGQGEQKIIALQPARG